LLSASLNVVHESKQPLLGRIQPVQLRPKGSKLREASLHNGLAELFLGFEVVVHIAYRNPGCVGDIR
jgi:hypothetical protein